MKMNVLPDQPTPTLTRPRSAPQQALSQKLSNSGGGKKGKKLTNFLQNLLEMEKFRTAEIHMDKSRVRGQHCRTPWPCVGTRTDTQTTDLLWTGSVEKMSWDSHMSTCEKTELEKTHTIYNKLA